MVTGRAGRAETTGSGVAAKRRTRLTLPLAVLAAAIGLAACATTGSTDAVTGAARARQLLGLPARGLASVPSWWVTVRCGDLVLSVPPAWPVDRLSSRIAPPGACDERTFPRPVVDLGEGFTGALWCPMISETMRRRATAPGDGVWLEAVGARWHPPRHVGPTVAPLHLVIHGLDVTLWYPVTGTSATLDVAVREHAGTMHLTLGVGRRPATVAARVLSSLRAAGG